MYAVVMGFGVGARGLAGSDILRSITSVVALQISFISNIGLRWSRTFELFKIPWFALCQRIGRRVLPGFLFPSSIPQRTASPFAGLLLVITTGFI
jgi:hypothetical protein